VFVKTPGKVSIKQKPIRYSFTNNSTHKAKVAEMVGVNTAVGIRLKRTTIFSRCKEGVVGVENLLG
jgi:hypothetical protein